MSIEQYTLTFDQLIICDVELGVDLCMQCPLPRLPLTLEGPGVIQDLDGEGNLLLAYLVCDGRRHGECRLFGEEGRRRAEMFYWHGKLHGPSVMYSETGKVLSKTWYCEGKKVGKSHFYSPSGALLSLQRFKEGEWEGIQEYFYESGAVKSRIPFLLGKLEGQVQLFWESGKPKRTVHYTKGLRQGRDLLWNEEGILIDEGEYSEGKPVGIHRHYFANGTLKQELSYHTPMRFDRKEFNERGKPTLEGIFAPDLTYTQRVFLEPHGSTVCKGVWDGHGVRWK